MEFLRSTTVAVNCVVAPACTEFAVPETNTLMGGGGGLE